MQFLTGLDLFLLQKQFGRAKSLARCTLRAAVILAGLGAAGAAGAARGCSGLQRAAEQHLNPRRTSEPSTSLSTSLAKTRAPRDTGCCSGPQLIPPRCLSVSMATALYRPAGTRACRPLEIHFQQCRDYLLDEPSPAAPARYATPRHACGLHAEQSQLYQIMPTRPHR